MLDKMKRLLSILFLACACLSASAATTRITLTLTITNNPVGLNTFVPIGKTLTFTNSTAGSPSTTVLLGANIGATATNLFRQLSTYPLTLTPDLSFSSSNVITIKGALNQAVSATASGTWATLTTSTQTISEMVAVRVPLSGEPTASKATNTASQLATDLGTFSTNALAAATTLVGNLVQTTGTQTIAGQKTWSGSNIISGQLTIANTAPYLQAYDSDGGVDEKYTVLGMGQLGFALSFYNDALTTPTLVFYVPRDGSSVTFISPVVATKFTGTLQNSGITNCILTNVTFAATNYSTGIFGHTRANNTSLANGSNAGIDFGAKVYVKLKAGPTAAFTINGIAGGADGRELIIDNSIAQNMTIANDSGTEPVPANRIYTRTGADVSTTGQGVVRLIYDSEDTHWILVSVQQ